jgi:multiple antibiotic resistance protein
VRQFAGFRVVAAAGVIGLAGFGQAAVGMFKSARLALTGTTATPMPTEATTLALYAGKSFLLVLATLLPILNPAATAPIFLGLTEGASADTRRVLAKRIATNMVMLITGAMLVGSYVLDTFGISLPIVRVAGGSIIAANAWRLLAVSPSTTDSRASLAEAFTPEMARTHAFYPLTFPISCGPGSLAAAITIGVTLHEDRLALSLARFAGGFGGLIVIGMVMFVAFRYATQLLKPLGDTGTTVFLRLSAFILLCLGVQIVWDGLSELQRSL